MVENFVSLLSLFLSVTAASAPAHIGAGGLAVAMIAAAIAVATLSTDAAARAADGVGPHPMRSIDVSSPLAQSDPDASGHPRPRAPGRAATAAI